MLDCSERDLTLTEAERSMIHAAVCGDEAVIAQDVEDPSKYAWQPEHEIRAEVIRALVLGLRDDWPVDPKGLRLRGSRIVGKLDLENGQAVCAVALLRCLFEDAPDLTAARMRRLRLTGSHTPGLIARNITIEGGLDLDRGFTSTGPVWLSDSSIRGSLSCAASSFVCPGRSAIVADRAHVTGGMFLSRGFTAKGEVRLLGARIGGDLDCQNGTLTNHNGVALHADRIDVTRSVFLRNSFLADGEVRLLGARIGGDLDCQNGTFTNIGGRALSADGARVAGSVMLGNGFNAHGEVALLVTTVGGSLDCREGTFNAPGGVAIGADGTQVARAVFLAHGFSATGEVRLLNATIGDILSCDDGRFRNPSGRALRVDRARIGSSFYLRSGFSASGEVFLSGATIGGNLDCQNGTFKGQGINAQGARVEGTLKWLGINVVGDPQVDFSYLTVRQLWDDWSSWHQISDLLLTGFIYREINSHSEMSLDQRMAWVAAPRKFSAQPYEQLARVLQQAGRPEAARKVAIAKEEALRRRGELKLPLRAWNWFFGKSAGHGYELWRPLVVLVALIVGATILFSMAPVRRALVPTAREAPVESAEQGCDPAYTCYQPFVYALDTVVPIIDLEQNDAWRPNGDAGVLGRGLLGFWWLLVVAGWILGTVVAAGAGALMQRRGK